jgi:hypothetical protein
MRRCKEEEQNQVAFVTWFSLQYPTMRRLLTLGSIGENVGPRRMKRLKEMGLTPGFPDLLFCYPVKKNQIYHPGLFIEMKSSDGKVKKHQSEIHQELRKQNFIVEVAYDWEHAKNIISSYILSY